MSETNPSADAVAQDLRLVLMQSIGRRVVVEFWFGSLPVNRCGVLTAVGQDYLLLRDDVNRQDIAGALGDVKLVTICDWEAVPAPAEDPATAEPQDAAEPIPDELSRVARVMAKPHAQAAFNYAKRKASRLE